jgi:hypothetical protein
LINPNRRQIIQLAERFFPTGIPWQIMPLMYRAFELWGKSCDSDFPQDNEHF